MDELTPMTLQEACERVIMPPILARIRTLESHSSASPENGVLLGEIRSLHERLNASDEAARRVIDAENTRTAHTAWGNFCNTWRRTLNPSTCPATPHEDQKQWPPAGAHASPRGTDSTV